MLGLCVGIGFFAELLDLPGWVRALSPDEHTPLVPAERFSATPLLVMTAIAVALVAAGPASFRTRDIG